MPTESSPDSNTAFLQRLLHRWFVQYNPLYLLSAVLVLVGLTLVSRGLSGDTSLWGNLGVGTVSELYAVALIGGAALLTRLDLPRPAVFVALIAVLYQGDLALGTETHALLGSIGLLASFVWLVVFVAKLRALGWALRLRLSRSALAVPSFGALGLATIPHLSRRLDSHALGMAVGLWLVALFAGALWTMRTVTSDRPLDAWGHTVLRRAVRATWTIWASLVLAHVLLWLDRYHLRDGIVLPVTLLLMTRWIRRESAVVAVVSAVMVFAGVSLPEYFQITALSGAVALSLHALRKPFDPGQADSSTPRDHYRGATVDDPTNPEPFAPSPQHALRRQLVWAGCAFYLFVWTFTWSGGAWPAHVVSLDLVVSGAAALFIIRTDTRIVALPLAATYLHWSIQSRLLRAPQSTLQWGITTVAVGFGLLFASLFASWRLGGQAPLSAGPALRLSHVNKDHAV